MWIPLKGEDCAFDFSGHTGTVRQLAWSPGGVGTANPNSELLLATGATDGVIKLWDVDKGAARATLAQHHGSVNGMGFSPDSMILASGGSDSMLQLYSVRDQSPVKTYTLAGEVHAVAWSHDGHFLAVGYPNRLMLLDLRYL